MSVKFLHTRIRVSDLERTIEWYSKTCGFEVAKRSDKSPAGNQIVLQVHTRSQVHKLAPIIRSLWS